MVIKKSFILLVASGRTPFFTFVSIISVKGCRLLKNNFLRKTRFSGWTTLKLCKKILTVDIHMSIEDKLLFKYVFNAFFTENNFWLLIFRRKITFSGWTTYFCDNFGNNNQMIIKLQEF